MHAKLGGFLHGEETIGAFRDGESAGADRPYFAQSEELERRLREEMADGRFKAGEG